VIDKYFVIYFRNGVRYEEAHENIADAVESYREKKRQDEFFDDRFVVGIKDEKGDIVINSSDVLRNKPIVLAIIPARGGSKRIPKKNIINFHGSPMIAWPIRALKESGVVDEILVSTDSEEVAGIAEKLGAMAPFRRPSSLSDDFVGTAEVTKHAIEWFIHNRGVPDYVLTIYPTAVFVSPNDIVDAVKLIEDRRTDVVFSAVEFPAPIQRALYIDSKGIAKMFNPENYNKRSQDLQTAYHDAGQFYLVKTDIALRGLSFNNSPSTLYVIPRDRVVDIDTPEDLRIAEKLFDRYFRNGETAASTIQGRRA